MGQGAGRRRISVVINTLNEEDVIRGCLESVKWADELVIVDMHSDDKTVEICRQYTDRIFFHERSGGFVEPARDFAIAQASGEWILVVDADERIPPALAAKLLDIASSDPGFDAAQIPFKNYILGKWMKHTSLWPDYHPRFFRRGVLTWGRDIHTTPTIEGVVHVLAPTEDIAVVHYGHESVSECLRRLNQYTSIQASQMVQSGKKFRVYQLVWKPARAFWVEYAQKRGFQDGLRGFLWSILMAIYYFITYAKLWEMERTDE